MTLMARSLRVRDRKLVGAIRQGRPLIGGGRGVYSPLCALLPSGRSLSRGGDRRVDAGARTENMD